MAKAWKAPGGRAPIRSARSRPSSAPSGASRTAGDSFTGSPAGGKPSADAAAGAGDLPVLPPGLYVTATPIGHSRDITLRALEIFRQVDVIAAEDTRVTSKLLAMYGIKKPLVSYNDHSPPEARADLVARIADGGRIAQVSDAGMPLVSDPGYKLVQAVLAAGLAVDVIPGASASLTALAQSGLPSDRFLFAGFLSAKTGERRGGLSELKGVRATLIFYESPGRLGACLADMADILGPRQAAVARELTKLHQEVLRASLSELAETYAGDPPRGEICIVVAPPAAAVADWDAAEAALARALAFMPLKAAAELVSELANLPRREVYARGLEIKTRDGAD